MCQYWTVCSVLGSAVSVPGGERVPTRRRFAESGTDLAHAAIPGIGVPDRLAPVCYPPTR
eukprot:2059117-Rhodomonas_salina.4